MDIPTLEKIIKLYNQKGYKVFDNGIPYKLNIGVLGTMI